MLIKRLRNKDVDISFNQVNRLIDCLFKDKYLDRKISKEHLREAIKNNIIISCWDNDVMVGMCSLVIARVVSRKVGFIEDVVVLPEYRGKGIGNLLIDYVIKTGKSLHLDAIEGATHLDNYKAIELYIGCKFIIDNVYHILYIFNKWKRA